MLLLLRLLALTHTVASLAPERSLFTISRLYAFTPLAYPSPSLSSWLTFSLTDASTMPPYTTLCSAVAEPNTTLSFGRNRYYDCDAQPGFSAVFFAFTLGEGFARVTVKKMWDNDGTYLTGFAEQQTHWSEAEGGNVTVGDLGKMYLRAEDWEFEITRVIG